VTETAFYAVQQQWQTALDYSDYTVLQWLQRSQLMQKDVHQMNRQPKQ